MITTDKILEIIQRAASSVDVTKIDFDTRLREYGVDSMDFFLIVVELQEIVGKDIPDQDLDQLRTVNAIQEYVKKNSY
jgi:acyl carrier protein